MCLLLVAHDCCPDYRLVVIANRDEFHARPTAAADWWQDRPDIVAGRDLEGGGTWLGMNVSGRFATVTNVRSGDRVRRGPRSRGLIVSDFLGGVSSAAQFSAGLAGCARDYDGFNLLAHDGRNLSWYSNQAAAPRALDPGVYTLSNAALDTAWPKTRRLRSGFDRVMERTAGDPLFALLDLLRDSSAAEETELPDTGVSRELERVLSSIFIEGPSYGTRCSSVVLLDRRERVRFVERRYDAEGIASGDSLHEFVLAS